MRQAGASHPGLEVGSRTNYRMYLDYDADTLYIYTMLMVYICTYKFIYTEMIDDMSTAFFSFWVLNQIATPSACPLTETLRTYTSDFPFQGKGLPHGPMWKGRFDTKTPSPSDESSVEAFYGSERIGKPPRSYVSKFPQQLTAGTLDIGGYWWFASMFLLFLARGYFQLNQPLVDAGVFQP